MRQRAAAIAAACLLLTASVPWSSTAEETGDAGETPAGGPQYTASADAERAVENSGYPGYPEYLASHAEAPAAAEQVTVPAAEYTAARGAELERVAAEGGERLNWSGGGDAGWTVAVPEAAPYQIPLRYCPLEGTGADIELGVQIDGAYPFAEAAALSLPRWWRNDGDSRTDAQGNEFTPVQTEAFLWSDGWLTDPNDVLSEPLQFYLQKGVNRLTVKLLNEAVSLEAIVLCPRRDTPAYEEYLKNHEGAADYTGVQLDIQGEKADFKSSDSLIPLTDQSSPHASPSDPQRSRLNYIGATNWQTTGDTLVWQVEVPESGFYTLSFKYLQSYLLNGQSYRSFAVDGEIPFAEAAQIAFPYATGWKVMTFADADGRAYRIYLEKGVHSLSLTASMGPMAEIYYDLQSVTEGLGTLYRKMTMIIGETPDANRDYDLFRQIPGLEEALTDYSARLEQIAVEMEKIAGMRGGSGVSVVRNMAGTLDRMLQYYWKIQMYKSDYYSNYGSLCAWLNERNNMPLALDQFMLTAPEAEVDPHMAGFFERIAYSAARFFSSFAADYDLLSGKEELTVWLYWGRDQSKVLDFMIRDSFTAQTGVAVNLQIVNASLVQGLISGKAPDCVLTLGRAQPVNMAMRGVLYDLTAFEDFDQVVAERYMPSACEPYMFNGGCYALPDAQQFFMLFYRTDVFEEIGLTVPKTWEEFLYCVTVIQRNNMQTGIPYAGVSEDSGGLQSLFPTLLLQMGGQMYNERLDGTDLTSLTAVQAFRFWTDLYTKYKLPQSYDFYTRFRMGEMPLAIASYTQYSLLSVAAPEISGRWAMDVLPGFEQEDGSIRNTSAATGTGAVMLKETENPQAAWEFLKWWTSAEVQEQFSREVESVLGISARHPTANVEAFSRYSWSGDGLEKMLEQWENTEEIPEVPGSYYTSRGIDQAFWNTVSLGENPREMLIRWSRFIDEEIQRKRDEYHLN